MTRLPYRHLKGHLPTGIDPVTVEYMRYFVDRGRAVLTYGG